MAGEKLKFELKLKELSVEMVGTDDQAKTYTLREVSGKQRDLFLNDMSKRVDFAKGEAQSISNFEGLQAGLLALCLYDENNKLVTKDVIQGYPSSVISSLFAEAQKLSGLDADAENEAKND